MFSLVGVAIGRGRTLHTLTTVTRGGPLLAGQMPVSYWIAPETYRPLVTSCLRISGGFVRSPVSQI